MKIINICGIKFYVKSGSCLMEKCSSNKTLLNIRQSSIFAIKRKRWGGEVCLLFFFSALEASSAECCCCNCG